jgi:hypothetical protein
VGTPDTKTWTASTTILSNAIRYNWSGGTGWDIAFNTSGSSNPHAWRDDSVTFPVDFSINQTTWYTGGGSACPDAETIYLRAANGDVHSFLSPQWQYSSANGPTVSSITADTIFVPSDNVSNTDFTLLKNGSAYANTNISLTGPSAQPPSDARGYTYTLTYTGTAFYTRTVDSKTYSDFYYDNSWTSSPTSGRSTNSNRILNVIGTIPAGTAITSDITLVLSSFSDRHIHYGNYDTILSGPTKQYGFYVTGNASDVVGYFYYYPTGFIGSVQYSSPFTIGDQATMSFTAGGHTVNLIDWIYSNEPEGSGYVPVSTTSNGGGKPDRYPLIMTNLFNRNRSIYSIGMTHKDTWDLFL